LCRRSYYRFFKEFWETIEAVEFVDNWHIEFICNELQSVYERWAAGDRQADILINVPPGSSKSTMVTQLFPAWLWVQNPSIRVISSSYAADLSIAHAVKTRDCILSDKFQACFPGLIELKEDTKGKSHFKNTKKGERFTTSTGGRVVGMHADFIINDDPISTEGAASQADLKTAKRFCTTTLPSRKTNRKRSVTILVMQRLHEEDPAGVMLSKADKKPVNHICLPAQKSEYIKPAHLAEKYVNDLLDTKRLDKESLDLIKIELGSLQYANQYMQVSAPEDGEYWRREWFKVIPDAIFPEPEELDAYGTDWDTAETEKQTNDAVGFVTSGKKDGKMYIDKVGFTRKKFVDMVKFMAVMPSPHFVEAKSSGKSSVEVLKDYGIVAVETVVKGGDKVARTQNATPPAEAGLVCIRESLISLLLDDDEQGIIKFPNNRHDDVNDALVQAIQRHFKRKKGWQIY